jgi:hypothetical protein
MKGPGSAGAIGGEYYPSTRFQLSPFEAIRQEFRAPMYFATAGPDPMERDSGTVAQGDSGVDDWFYLDRCDPEPRFRGVVASLADRIGDVLYPRFNIFSQFTV